MAWFEDEGAHVYYEETGTGDPVVAIPGWGGSVDEFRPLQEALAGTYRVLLVDPPGSGRSGPQPRTYTPDYYHDDARLLMAILGSLRASPAHIVGFSDGGEYALLMAAYAPENVRSVVTWGAAGTLGKNFEAADAMAALIDDPIPPMAEFADYLKETYGEANARVMTQSAGAAFRAIMEAGGDISRSVAATITCPALLMTGEHDFLATPALVSEIASAIPRGEFLAVPGASHAVHHEEPDWLVKRVVDWLARH